MRLGSQLPVLYEKLLPTEFLALNATEKTANCSNCYMCESGARAPSANLSANVNPFLSSTKCCTYYPFLPNYLVGGMLAAAEPEPEAEIKNNDSTEAKNNDPAQSEAAQHMRELIRNRQWALPIGVIAPPSYQLKFQNKHKDDFGRRADMVCPFYKAQSGQCGIWKWRDSQCSTYFCVYDDPQAGPVYWSTIQQFLYDVEMRLSQECMLHKGFSLKEIESNLKWVRFTESSDQTKPYSLSALDWSSFWQHHHDKIELYYIECYKLVSSQNPELKKEIKEIHQKYEWNQSTPAKST